MRAATTSLIVSSLAAAGVLALGEPAAADPPWKGHGHKDARSDDGDGWWSRDDDRGHKHHKHKHKYKKHGHDDYRGAHHTYWHKTKTHDYRAASFSGGPPPWAPAWGYRARQAEVAYGGGYGSPYAPEYAPDYFIPYGIASGTCNRASVGYNVGSAVGDASGNFMKANGADAGVATLAGTVIGALVSAKVSRRMDRVDQACIGQILEYAPDGRNIAWSQATNGPRYDVVPLTTYRTPSGTYCREYQTTTFFGGRMQREYGLACRQPNGAWQVG